jgi:hypothetical protein
LLAQRIAAPLGCRVRSLACRPKRRIWRVYIVHTSGFGPGRSGAGLARLPHVSGTSQCLQGRECSSSPTSGTCFPCSGACEPLNVYKSPLMGPCRGPFLLVAKTGPFQTRDPKWRGIAAHRESYLHRPLVAAP